MGVGGVRRRMSLKLIKIPRSERDRPGKKKKDDFSVSKKKTLQKPHPVAWRPNGTTHRARGPLGDSMRKKREKSFEGKTSSNYAWDLYWNESILINRSILGGDKDGIVNWGENTTPLSFPSSGGKEGLREIL